MKKENTVQNVIIALLCVTVLFMSVGFAVSAYNDDLEINGSATATAAVWKVEFDPNSYSEENSTGYVASTSHSVTGTTTSFDVTLDPGEKFAFSVDAKNFGTLAAKLTSVSLSGTLASLTSDESEFLSYTVKVDGTTYSASTSDLNVALAANDTHTVEVEVSYNLPSDASKLPSTDVTKALTVTLNYASVLETN